MRTKKSQRRHHAVRIAKPQLNRVLQVAKQIIRAQSAPPANMTAGMKKSIAPFKNEHNDNMLFVGKAWQLKDCIEELKATIECIRLIERSLLLGKCMDPPANFILFVTGFIFLPFAGIVMSDDESKRQQSNLLLAISLCAILMLLYRTAGFPAHQYYHQQGINQWLFEHLDLATQQTLRNQCNKANNYLMAISNPKKPLQLKVPPSMTVLEHTLKVVSDKYQIVEPNERRQQRVMIFLQGAKEINKGTVLYRFFQGGGLDIAPRIFDYVGDKALPRPPSIKRG